MICFRLQVKSSIIELTNFADISVKGKYSGFEIVEHFPEVRKTIEMRKNATKEVLDYELSRYACYLIVQNGDPRKKY